MNKKILIIGGSSGLGRILTIFFLKNKIIKGACGLGIVGKVGRDIRITSKLSEKNTIVDTQILSDETQKLNKLIQK